LAVGIAIMLMIALKVTHPPAGGNPIAVMIGGVSFPFLIFPIMAGAITIIIGGIIYNSLILKKKYPISEIIILFFKDCSNPPALILLKYEFGISNHKV
jgi:CBS-domain-containing membrane protein